VTLLNLLQPKPESGPTRETDDEAIKGYGRSRLSRFCGSRGPGSDGGGLPQAWCGDVYKWKAKFGGLNVSEARRLKALEDENGRLERLLTDSMLKTPR
jgi:hypothetical protein